MFPLVGARTDVTTTSKTSSTLEDWTPNGVINESVGEEPNRTWWRSKIPMDGTAPDKGFLRLETNR